MTLVFLSGKSVRDKVIITLGKVWPLTPKEIVLYIKNNLGVEITYQAVHKAINELADEDVILKTSKGFMLNKDWVGSLTDFITVADQSYKIGISKKDTGDSEQLTVDCIWDWYSYILLMLEKHSNDPYATKVPCIFQKIHPWNTLVVGKQEFLRVMKVAPKYNIYCVVGSNTPLDHAIEKFWLNVTPNYKVNVPLTVSNDVVVIGDNVYQASYPQDIHNALDKFFLDTKTIEEMDVAKFQVEIFYKKTGIFILRTKNKAYADRIRQETLRFF